MATAGQQKTVVIFWMLYLPRPVRDAGWLATLLLVVVPIFHERLYYVFGPADATESIAVCFCRYVDVLAFLRSHHSMWSIRFATTSANNQCGLIFPTITGIFLFNGEYLDINILFSLFSFLFCETTSTLFSYGCTHLYIHPDSWSFCERRSATATFTKQDWQEGRFRIHPGSSKQKGPTSIVRLVLGGTSLKCYMHNIWRWGQREVASSKQSPFRLGEH